MAKLGLFVRRDAACRIVENGHEREPNLATQETINSAY